MNELIISEISKDLNIKDYQIKNTLKLLEEGNTVPFIARYRKEMTNSLNETDIKKISDVYNYELNLLKRKEDVIRLIDEKGLLTEDLKQNILGCKKLVEIEDIYRPFKEKKQTKATKAIELGLKPLAFEILKCKDINLEKLINDFKCKTDDYNEKLNGAKDIIAEIISDNANYRKYIRKHIFLNGDISTTKKKNSEDKERVYDMYYDYIEKIKYIKPHRVLAINRGENENILNVSFKYDLNDVLEYLEKKLIKGDNSCSKVIKEAILDSYKRLIYPSIEREIRKELSDKANVLAIENFANNLEKLLLTPPMKDITVLGFDPAYRTGCKLAVVDPTSKMLEIAVIYPHEPRNEKEKSQEKMLELIKKYNVDVIAIGNGTASRESEEFVANLIKSNNLNCKYIIVSEAGASVYSASPLAKCEYPDLDVSERSAISIARRLQDPLSELVKIDPKSIGVGLYQHDVKKKELDESLTFSVLKIVNQVGVNINTASKSILSYISGLNKKVIDEIIDERDRVGKFTSREELKKLKKMNDKIYEQAIGFLRINGGSNVFDETSIHPESYHVAEQILEISNIKLEDLKNESSKEKLAAINIEELRKKLNVDSYTINDIILALQGKKLDPRDDVVKPMLRSDILKLEDLKEGMKLQGTVRNVVDFGAFVDIGLKNDGLIHISNMTDKYIRHPKEILNIGDIIDVYVKEILLDKKKVQLSLKEIK